MSAESRTVKVSNLSTSTTKEGLSQFIGFCGQIEALELDGQGTATVIFSKESAAHTATLLNGGTLDGNCLTIHSGASEVPNAKHPDDAAAATAEGEDIDQEHKPRSAVVAEMLAHGYTLSDTAVQKAIDVDGKFGISQRFLSFFSRAQQSARGLDEKHGVTTTATSTAKSLDSRYGLGERASRGRNLGLSYYQKGLASPWGSKIYDFYTSTTKQAKDIHDEAMRIKESKNPSQATGVSASSKDAQPVEDPADAGDVKPAEPLSAEKATA